jgi:hypothetical protein
MTVQAVGNSPSVDGRPERQTTFRGTDPDKAAEAARAHQATGRGGAVLHLPHPLVAEHVVLVEVQDHAHGHGAERRDPLQRLHRFLHPDAYP